MTSPVLAYYGDDFTGSADVMEVLQWSGLRTVLFLDPPTREQLNSIEGLRAFGVAGWSRTMSPEEMEIELRPVFRELQNSGASIIHYKTCSTFDSSPEIGNIGKAIALGREVFDSGVVPVVIAAPNLGRYQAFGNLFARSGLDTEPYRLDRHPTMQHHPITPMAESDLRRLLSEQANLKVALFDLLRLERVGSENAGTNTLREKECKPNLRGSDDDVLLFDALYEDHMPRIGCLIDSLIDPEKPTWMVGSSGIEYALTQYWSEAARLESMQTRDPGHPTFAATEQLVVLTGSCSPVNDRQIAWAERNGFESIAINTAALVSIETAEQEIETSVRDALSRLADGANIILHSSRGPDDPRVVETNVAFRKLGFNEQDIKLRSSRILGPQLGKILRGILGSHRFTRVGVAGGDTSGYIARELEITALEAIAPVAPGSPLCVAYARNSMNGIEFFFKGGQVGKDDVWGTMLSGTALPEAAQSSKRK